MAKTVTRQPQRQFGVNGDPSFYGQFGSKTAGSPVDTKNIVTIQALSAFLTGLQDAINAGSKAPFLEDMNGVLFVIFYQIFYMLQEGIAEWDAGTTYYIGAVVREVGTGYIYQSLTDSNLNNALPAHNSDNTNWTQVYPVRFSALIGTIANAQIPSSAILTPNIQDAAVTTPKIADANVTDAKIVGLQTGKLTGVKLSNHAFKVGAAGQLTQGDSVFVPGSGSVTVTFPVAFAAAPTVVVCPVDSNVSMFIVGTPTTTQVVIGNASTSGKNANYIAVGAGS